MKNGTKEFGFKDNSVRFNNNFNKTSKKKHLVIKIAAILVILGLSVSSISIFRSEPNKFMAITRILSYEMPIILLIFFSSLFVIFFKIYSNNKDAEWLPQKYKKFFAAIEYLRNRRQ